MSLTPSLDIISSVKTLLESCLQFRVSVSMGEAREILQDFPNLRNFVNHVQNKVGPCEFEGDNPNNGNFTNIRLSIGRENSLVIYLETNSFYRPKDTPEAIEKRLNWLKWYFKPEEFTIEKVKYQISGKDATRFNVRFWFDKQ